MVGQLVTLTYAPQEIVARYTEYAPSLIEIVSSVGIVAYGLMLFTLGVRYLKVVDHREVAEHEPEAKPALAPAD
jgi:Ni/Fe-hydrogenase subunit HybB-like protein